MSHERSLNLWTRRRLPTHHFLFFWLAGWLVDVLYESLHTVHRLAKAFTGFPESWVENMRTRWEQGADWELLTHPDFSTQHWPQSPLQGESQKHTAGLPLWRQHLDSTLHRLCPSDADNIILLLSLIAPASEPPPGNVSSRHQLLQEIRTPQAAPQCKAQKGA